MAGHHRQLGGALCVGVEEDGYIFKGVVTITVRFINKYAGHFRTFEEIINCLGEKLTNEGHSYAAAVDAKGRT